MNIENIEAFVYINHYGSFNKAADVLFLSQPTVTARIQSLERELDCRLFDRLGKQIHLTDKGKQFLPYAQQILQTFQKGKHHLQSKVSMPNELRIGSTVSVSNYLMPHLLMVLNRRFPKINFKLTTGPTEELAGKLSSKEIDLAFVRKLMNPAFQSYSFYEDPIRLYVYKDHPLASVGRASIRDIRHETLVFFECGSLDWLRIHRVFESLEQPPNIVFQVDNSETAKKLVLGRAGICFLPGLCAQQEVAAGSLIPVDIAETAGISLQTHLISLNGQNNEFLNSLLELGRELSY
ncbi:LysR family transcriptional regulator [Paenibacillus sp. JCM 10914]|uniref:LysR family transcriptional regulator n=1 Tax=Paenibacillus sp. JCM 10914 TaxID=1236974 RepID=UPI0003CC809F|nr:LysR family transcriptional regulator [Paenibacillus sp. JCM 10914]GAE09445.1 transcriptional regulator, LysR family protein [Paenibacillus sp. JCM 10914]